jgi:hypothetical protein
MNGCSTVQAGFTEYLDGRLNGREMSARGSGNRCVMRNRRLRPWDRRRNRRTCRCGFAWR